MIVSSLWRFPKIGAPLNNPKSNHCSIDTHPKIGVAPWNLHISMISPWYPHDFLIREGGFSQFHRFEPQEMFCQRKGPRVGPQASHMALVHPFGPDIPQARWGDMNSIEVTIQTWGLFLDFMGATVQKSVFFFDFSRFQDFFCMASSSFIRVPKARISK